MNKPAILIIMLFLCSVSFGQFYHFQYFDGADTLAGESLVVTFENDSTNIWQIGAPQKTFFTTAATSPNVLVTDTLLPYPSSDTSVFYVDLSLDGFSWGVIALEWMQQLDYPAGEEGGTIEFWNPDTEIWENCFNNPLVYNFYGYDASNVATTPFGTQFTGMDSTWNSIWLCFDMSYFSIYTDTILVRFMHFSDTTANTHDGWMIDNMISHPTMVHTVAEKEQAKYMEVYPTASTDGLFHIKGKKKQEFHIIEHLEVYDSNGKLVKSFGTLPTVYTLNLGDLPAGNYRLHITTNFETNTFPIILTK